VERLKAKGFTAFRLEDGIHEWQSLGLPIEEDDSMGLQTIGMLGRNAQEQR